MRQLLPIIAATLALAACADDYGRHGYRGYHGGRGYGADTGPRHPGYYGDHGPGDGRGGHWRDGGRGPHGDYRPAPTP